MLLWIVGFFIVSYLVRNISYGSVSRSLKEFPRDRALELFEKSNRRNGWFNIIEYVGLFGIVVGFLILLRKIPISSPYPIGTYTIAGSFIVICIGSALKFWDMYAVFSKEPDTEKLTRKAQRFAIIVTLLEIALIAVICYWASTARVIGGNANNPKSNPANSNQNQTDPSAPNAGRSNQNQNAGTVQGIKPLQLWITEDDALKELGKEKGYLEKLIKLQEVRAQEIDGKRMIRNDDIQSLLESGLRKEQDLDYLLDKREIQKEESKSQPKPNEVLQE